MKLQKQQNAFNLPGIACSKAYDLAMNDAKWMKSDIVRATEQSESRKPSFLSTSHNYKYSV